MQEKYSSGAQDLLSLTFTEGSEPEEGKRKDRCISGSKIIINKRLKDRFSTKDLAKGTEISSLQISLSIPSPWEVQQEKD